jgi:hypothetical protein
MVFKVQLWVYYRLPVSVPVSGPVSYQLVNRLISVNYSFDAYPTSPGNLVSLARNQYPTCT